jgi:hypothetical protein
MKYIAISDIHGNPQVIETVVDAFSYHQELGLHRTQYDIKKIRTRIIDEGLPKVLGARNLYGR